MDVKLLSFTFSAFLLGGVFVGANASGCADIEKVKTAIGDISDFYGDVRPSVDCQRQIGRIDKLVCGDDELRLIEQLDTKAWVYAYENATKRELNHRKRNLDTQWINTIRDKCGDASCLCRVYKDHTNDSLGGRSPYYEG